MNCKNVLNLLHRYADNELLESEKIKVLEHLPGCIQCTNKVNELLKLKELVGGITPYPGNPFLWTRIANEIKEGLPIPIGILIPKFLKVWVPIAAVLIFLSGYILYKLPEPQKSIQKGTLSTIFDMPITPENMEKLTLNLLVYSNGIKEVPHVKF